MPTPSKKTSLETFCVLTGEDEDQFEQFMLPLTAAFEAIAQMFSTNTFNEQEAKVRRIFYQTTSVWHEAFAKDLVFSYLLLTYRCISIN